jgi:hypothetical protein
MCYVVTKTQETWYDVVAADIWGCGVILFFLLTAMDPDLGQTDTEVIL